MADSVISDHVLYPSLLCIGKIYIFIPQNAIFYRGLIISTMQAIFSCVFYFASVSLYQGILMVA